MQTQTMANNEEKQRLALRDTDLLNGPTEEQFDRLTRIARQLFNCQTAAISFIDDEQQWCKSSSGEPLPSIPGKDSLCSQTLLGKDIVQYSDIQHETQFKNHPILMYLPQLRFYASIPLRSASQHNIGTLSIIDNKPKTLTPDEIVALKDLAACVEQEIIKSTPQPADDAVKQQYSLRQIIDKAPLGIWLQNTDGRLLLVNQTFCQDLGISESTFTSVAHYSEIYPTEIATNCMSSDKAALEQSQPHISYEQIQFTDGKLHDLEIIKARLFDEEGNISGLIGISSDITERNRIEKMQNELISTVSHELRTPLAAIAGAVDLIRGGVLGEVSVPAQQMMEVAYNNSERLKKLLDNLLDMEKLSTGNLQLDYKQHKLIALIEQSISNNRTQGKKLEVDVRIKGKPKPILINLDAQRFQQIMNNLLSNATKFSPKGGQVNISINISSDVVRIEIEDSGPGIPTEFHNQIFKKFVQADATDTRQKGGTGLGLAISKGLITLMKGDIGFYSTEGQGTTFYIELPVLPTNKAHKKSATKALFQQQSATRLHVNC